MKAMTPRRFSSKTTLYKTRTWVVACHSVGGSKTTWRNSGFMRFIKKVMPFSKVLYLRSTLLCIEIFFCKSKETIGYYQYITDKRIYCFFFFLGCSPQEFDGFFWNTPLGRDIAKTDLEMQTEFFQRYLRDFICMTMNVTCQEDIQVDFFFV